MTTLSPFLWPGGKQDSAGQKQAEALNRIVSVLLQGIALHTYNFDPAQFEAFDNAIRKVRHEFEHAPDEATALLSAGAAIRLLEEHGDAAEQHWRSRQHEFQSAMALLSDTLLDLAGAAPEAAVRIRGIETDIALACNSGSAVAARLKLEACLAEVRAEVAAARVPENAGPVQERDSVTGLPDPACAARALNFVWNRRKDYYVAILALERIETINLRFGFHAGDRMLQQFSQHVAQHLTPEDQLFRWRGPCLAMLLHRREPEPVVTGELNRLTGTRLETGLVFREREVMVPVSVSWNLFHVNGAGSLEELVRQMNEFAASRTRAGRRVLAAAT